MRTGTCSTLSSTAMSLSLGAAADVVDDVKGAEGRWGGRGGGGDGGEPTPAPTTTRPTPASWWKAKPKRRQTLCSTTSIRYRTSRCLPSLTLPSGYGAASEKVASEVRDLGNSSSYGPGKQARHLRTSGAVRLRQSATATEVGFSANESTEQSNCPCSSCFLCVCAVVAFSRSSPLGRPRFSLQKTAQRPLKPRKTRKRTSPARVKHRGVSGTLF